MHRKDYLAIAQAFNDELNKNPKKSPARVAEHAHYARLIGKVLRNDNARFDMERFLTACGLDEFYAKV